MSSMLALQIYVTPEDRDAIVSLFERVDHDIAIGLREGHPIYKVYGIGSTEWVETLKSR